MFRIKPLFKTLKKQLQTWRLRVGKYILDTPPPSSSQTLNIQGIHSILFLRQDGKIGDYIVSSFAFREIKKKYPHIKIGLICNTQNRAIFEQNSYIDEIYTVRPKSTLSYWKMGKQISKQYDVVIDPTVFLRNRDLILLRTLKAKHNIGFLKEQYQLFNHNITQADLHFSHIYAQALALCGLTDVDMRYDLPENPIVAEKIHDFLQQNHIQNHIVVNFFGAANSKKFHAQSIQKYLLYFSEKLPNTPIVLLTYPEVTPMLQKIACDFQNVFLYANTQTIADSMELIRQSRGVITVDTSIIHIAAGLNKKIIGFYHENPIENRRWRPLSQNEVVLFYYKHNINEIEPTQLADVLTHF